MVGASQIKSEVWWLAVRETIEVSAWVISHEQEVWTTEVVLLFATKQDPLNPKP